MDDSKLPRTFVFLENRLRQEFANRVDPSIYSKIWEEVKAAHEPDYTTVAEFEVKGVESFVQGSTRIPVTSRIGSFSAEFAFFNDAAAATAFHNGLETRLKENGAQEFFREGARIDQANEVIALGFGS